MLRLSILEDKGQATDAMERVRSTYDAVAERYADAMVNKLHERPLERGSMPSCSR
jgi:hypothetical protein